MEKNMTFAIRGCSPNFNLRADAFINFMLLSFLHQYLVNIFLLKNVLKDISKRKQELFVFLPLHFLTTPCNIA